MLFSLLVDRALGIAASLLHGWLSVRTLLKYGAATSIAAIGQQNHTGHSAQASNRVTPGPGCALHSHCNLCTLL